MNISRVHTVPFDAGKGEIEVDLPVALREGKLILRIYMNNGDPLVSVWHVVNDSDADDARRLVLDFYGEDIGPVGIGASIEDESMPADEYEWSVPRNWIETDKRIARRIAARDRSAARVLGKHFALALRRAFR